MVENSASVFIWALHVGLDLARRQEISPVFRVPSSLYWYPSQIILFDHGLSPLQKYSSFFLRNKRLAKLNKD